MKKFATNSKMVNYGIVIALIGILLFSFMVSVEGMTAKPEKADSKTTKCETTESKLVEGASNRKKGKPVRFIFDRDIDTSLLTYLVKRLGLSEKDNLIPGGKIHNFKDFIDFPESVFEQKNTRKKPFVHPIFLNAKRVSDIVLKKDVLLNFPYHSYDY